MASRNKAPAVREFRNVTAARNYHLEERFEAGLVLRGTEVKAIRSGLVNLKDAFCKVEKGEVFLYQMHVSEYAFGNIHNHLPLRPRKLLLNRREIAKIRVAMEAGGKSLIATKLYFKEALLKVEIALATGKKEFDKRADIKDREVKRSLQRVVMRARG